MDNVKAFIKHVHSVAKLNGIKIQAHNSKSIRIDKGISVSGYFSSEEKKLAYAKKNKQWLEILIHESCHMDQFIEQTDIWMKAMDGFLIDEWLQNKNIPQGKINRAINHTRDLELDCEKRSVRKIKEWNLPVDIDLYIQRANCYVLFYNWLKETRKWSTSKNSPYSNKNIYSKASKTWLKNYSYIPQNIRKVFNENNV